MSHDIKSTNPMSSKTIFISAAFLSLALALASSGQVQAEEPSAKDHLGEATESLLRAFDLMIRAIPQYEAPEVLENGDIIIRRKNPEREPSKQPNDPTPLKTDT